MKANSTVLPEEAEAGATETNRVDRRVQRTKAVGCTMNWESRAQRQAEAGGRSSRMQGEMAHEVARGLCVNSAPVQAVQAASESVRPSLHSPARCNRGSNQERPRSPKEAGRRQSPAQAQQRRKAHEASQRRAHGQKIVAKHGREQTARISHHAEEQDRDQDGGNTGSPVAP